MGAQSHGEPAQAAFAFAESERVARAAGSDLAAAEALEARGTCARLLDDSHYAAVRFAESLRLIGARMVLAAVASCIMGLGYVTTALGWLEPAARLFGAGVAQRERHGIDLGPFGEPQQIPAVVAARIQLGDAAFTASWAAGRTLPLEQALAEAQAVAEAVMHADPTPPTVVGGLTHRESEVLRLLAAGRSNREIAHALSLSERPIEHHVLHILRKLDLPSRTAAAAYAHTHHLL